MFVNVIKDFMSQQVQSIVDRFTTSEIDNIKEYVRTARNEITKARKYFYWFLNILDQQNIEYFAAFGTLLGTIRDQSVIPWDDDYDLYITDNTKKTFIEKLDLYKKSIEREMNIKNYTVPENLMANNAKVFFTFSTIIDNKQIYVCFTESKWKFYQLWVYDDNFKYICKITDIFYQCKTISYDSPKLYPILKKRLDDIEINVMHNYDAILQLAYGENYMNEYYICNHKIASTFFHKDRNKYTKLNKTEFDDLMNIINAK